MYNTHVNNLRAGASNKHAHIHMSNVKEQFDIYEMRGITRQVILSFTHSINDVCTAI